MGVTLQILVKENWQTKTQNKDSRAAEKHLKCEMV